MRLITPDWSKVNPAALMTNHLKGATSAVAVKVTGPYACPLVPEGNSDAVVITSGNGGPTPLSKDPMSQSATPSPSPSWSRTAPR